LLLVEPEQCLVLGVEVIEEGPGRNADLGANILDSDRLRSVSPVQTYRGAAQRGPGRSLFSLPQATTGTHMRGAHQQSPTNGIFVHSLQNYIQCSECTPSVATCDQSRCACSRPGPLTVPSRGTFHHRVIRLGEAEPGV